MSIFERTERLLGEAGVRKLQSASVAIFGIGGVGGFAAEALARAGVGRLLLVDADTVAESNINRQIIADYSTVGRYKTEVMAERIGRINPAASVETRNVFYLPEDHGGITLAGFDYVIDAVDTVAAKLEIIVEAQAAGVPVISCMGAGNKLDPTRFTVSDIYKTSVCPLAKVMRRELKKRGITACKVVWSPEEPIAPKESAADIQPQTSGKRSVPGSVSFVPSVAGLIAAGEVIRAISGA